MFAKFAGRTLEEMARIDWMSITHPDDVQKDLDQMALLNAGEIPGFQMEKRYLRRDGSVVWINMTIAPVKVEDKAQPRHLCMIEDITQRKLAEATLTQAEGLSATILDSIDDHIVILDCRTFKIQGANKAFLRDYGLTREQVLGRTCHEVTHESASPCSGTGNSCPIQAMLDLQGQGRACPSGRQRRGPARRRHPSHQEPRKRDEQVAHLPTSPRPAQ